MHIRYQSQFIEAASLAVIFKVWGRIGSGKPPASGKSARSMGGYWAWMKSLKELWQRWDNFQLASKADTQI